MSGILNTKQRILDTIITQQGRAQMVNGKFSIKYVTFTDGATFYRADLSSGSEDPTNRLFFECSQLPQDQITFVTDDDGKIQHLTNHSGYGVRAGKIFSGSSTNLQFVTGSAFAGAAETLLGSSIDNFRKLLTIGTIDPVFEDAEFQLSHDNLNFIMTDHNPIQDPYEQSANINNLESFFADQRFSNLPNFNFLPPINKVTDSDLDLTNRDIQQQLFSPLSPSHIASYRPLGPTSRFSYKDDIQPKIDAAAKNGNVKIIRFDPTTNKNNLAIQVFEMHSDTLLKLDVIEFGHFPTQDPLRPDRHIFFAGKVFLDDNGTHTFVRIFTLIFE